MILHCPILSSNLGLAVTDYQERLGNTDRRNKSHFCGRNNIIITVAPCNDCNKEVVEPLSKIATKPVPVRLLPVVNGPLMSEPGTGHIPSRALGAGGHLPLAGTTAPSWCHRPVKRQSTSNSSHASAMSAREGESSNSDFTAVEGITA